MGGRIRERERRGGNERVTRMQNAYLILLPALYSLTCKHVVNISNVHCYPNLRRDWCKNAPGVARQIRGRQVRIAKLVCYVSPSTLNTVVNDKLASDGGAGK
jgi:hypothetical protein